MYYYLIIIHLVIAYDYRLHYKHHIRITIRIFYFNDL